MTDTQEGLHKDTRIKEQSNSLENDQYFRHLKSGYLIEQILYYAPGWGWHSVFCDKEKSPAELIVIGGRFCRKSRKYG